MFQRVPSISVTAVVHLHRGRSFSSQYIHANQHTRIPINTALTNTREMKKHRTAFDSMISPSCHFRYVMPPASLAAVSSSRPPDSFSCASFSCFDPIDAVRPASKPLIVLCRESPSGGGSSVLDIAASIASTQSRDVFGVVGFGSNSLATGTSTPPADLFSTCHYIAVTSSDATQI